MREYIHYIVCNVRSGIRRNAHENDRTHSTEHIDTYNAGRDYHGMNTLWCRKKPTRNEKVRRQCGNTFNLLYAMFALASGVTHMRTTKHVETYNAAEIIMA